MDWKSDYFIAYGAGILMIGTGLGKLIGIDLPWIEISTDPTTLIGNGLAAIGIRKTLAANIGRAMGELLKQSKS